MLALYGTVPLDLPRNGPTAVLVNRLQSLGWTIGGNGLIQDAFGSFNLVSLGFEELLVRFTLSWGVVLEREVGHRTTMHGINTVDLFELHAALGQYGPGDLAFLRCHLDGTLYVNNGRAKFQHDVTNQCPWCSDRDGFYHRAWICPHLLPVVAILPQTSCLPFHNCRCVCLSMVGLSFCQSGRSMSVICWIHLIRVVSLSSRLIMVSQMNGLICLLMAQQLALRIPNSAIRCMGRHPGYWRSW